MASADSPDSGESKASRRARGTRNRLGTQQDPIVPVNPEVLQWAVKRSGISREDLLKRFKEIPEWECGTLDPTYNQVQKLADALHVPSGYLLMSNPPDEKLPVEDLRTFNGGGTRRNSADLVETVYSCKTRQNWYRDFSKDTGLPRLGFVGSNTIKEPPVEVAERMHIALDLRYNTLLNLGSTDEARRLLIRKMDLAGILVMSSGVVGNNTRRRLCPEEFRGFALSDRHAPVVFVNRNVTASEQLFTLANKLAHVWINSSAISNKRSVDDKKSSTKDDWCTKVAEQFLASLQSPRKLSLYKSMPKRSAQMSYLLDASRDVRNVSYFHSHIRPKRSYEDILENMSMSLIERNLKDSDNTTTVDKKSLRGFYPVLISRVGMRFARAVVSRCLDGKMPYQDAYEMLGVSSKEKLVKIRRHIGTVL